MSANPDHPQNGVSSLKPEYDKLIEQLLKSELGERLARIQKLNQELEKDLKELKSEADLMKKPLKEVQKVFEEEEEKRIIKEREKENRNKVKDKKPDDKEDAKATAKPEENGETKKNPPKTPVVTKPKDDAVKPAKEPVSKPDGSKPDPHKPKDPKPKDEKPATATPKPAKKEPTTKPEEKTPKEVKPHANKGEKDKDKEPPKTTPKPAHKNPDHKEPHPNKTGKPEAEGKTEKLVKPTATPKPATKAGDKKPDEKKPEEKPKPATKPGVPKHPAKGEKHEEEKDKHAATEIKKHPTKPSEPAGAKETKPAETKAAESNHPAEPTAPAKENDHKPEEKDTSSAVKQEPTSPETANHQAVHAEEPLNGEQTHHSDSKPQAEADELDLSQHTAEHTQPLDHTENQANPEEHHADPNHPEAADLSLGEGEQHEHPEPVLESEPEDHEKDALPEKEEEASHSEEKHEEEPQQQGEKSPSHHEEENPVVADHKQGDGDGVPLMNEEDDFGFDAFESDPANQLELGTDLVSAAEEPQDHDQKPHTQHVEVVEKKLEPLREVHDRLLAPEEKKQGQELDNSVNIDEFNNGLMAKSEEPAKNVLTSELFEKIDKDMDLSDVIQENQDLEGLIMESDSDLVLDHNAEDKADSGLDNAVMESGIGEESSIANKSSNILDPIHTSFKKKLDDGFTKKKDEVSDLIGEQKDTSLDFLEEDGEDPNHLNLEKLVIPEIEAAEAENENAGNLIISFVPPTAKFFQDSQEALLNFVLTSRSSAKAYLSSLKTQTSESIESLKAANTKKLKMFSKEIQQGYPEYKPQTLITDILKIIDSSDPKKFFEKFDKVGGGIVFYLIWITFFDVIPKEQVTSQLFLDNFEKIEAILKNFPKFVQENRFSFEKRLFIENFLKKDKSFFNSTLVDLLGKQGSYFKALIEELLFFNACCESQVLSKKAQNHVHVYFHTQEKIAHLEKKVLEIGQLINAL